MAKRKIELVDLDEKKENEILETWITRNYGSRCPDYQRECACCKAWKCYDYLVIK